jgi:hypothetical protein
MAKESIIPEFMVNNPDDAFQFLMPLKLKLDEDKFGNSHYEVIIKNLETKELFTYLIAPELLFTHFQLGKSYKNGIEIKKHTDAIFEESFIINSNLIDTSKRNKLKDFLDDKSIGTLIGWKYTYLNTAKNINCHILEQNNKRFIIPHYAIGIYYYFRFTDLREAVLDINLESLYILSDNSNPDDANIVIPKKRNDEDVAFIHRYSYESIAKTEFENIGKYINSYVNYMKNNNIDKDVEDIHLIINFPVKDLFNINTRMSRIVNKKTNIEYYYIHEIINDYSYIGFNKLTKIVEEHQIITDIENINNLPIINKEIPNETTDILRILDANKKYTRTEKARKRKNTCGSLEHIEIDHASIQKDTITNILKICHEQFDGKIVDQSLTESSSKGKNNIRKISVSNEFIEERIKNPLKEIDNFEVFKQYIDFLKKQTQTISNLSFNKEKSLPEFILQKNDKINPKCKIYKRSREYLTVTFKYNNFYVGLLELENYPSSSASTWVIISRNSISDIIFDKFLSSYFKIGNTITDITENSKNTDPKFTKKNHERDENLDKKQLATWFTGLLSKIY